MTALTKYRIRCLYLATKFYCLDRSVCVLIKTEKLSFLEMLWRELCLWRYVKKVVSRFHSWINVMMSSN